MKKLLLVLFICLGSFSLMALPAAKLIQEAVKAAARVSGKKLTPAAQQSAVKALSKAAAKYGDDALKVVREGGLEALKQGSRYGDDFWRAARHAEPAAIRSLALHTEELLPLARRIGPEFLKLEAKAPGLAARAAALFGDDGVKILAKAPGDDLSRLIGAAGKADSLQTRNFLLKAYENVPDKEKFLSFFNWKNIAATGVSAAAVTLAYKAGGGVEEGLKTLAEKDPESFGKIISGSIAPFKWLIFVIVVLAIFPFLKFLWKRSGITFLKKVPREEKKNPESEQKAVQEEEIQENPENKE